MEIPYPHLQSWMHERIEVPRETREERLNRYLSQKRGQLGDYFASKMVHFFNLQTEKARWVLYRIVMGYYALKFRLTNRWQIRGRENVPSGGAIFYLNHRGKKDVLMFMAALYKLTKHPLSVFTAVGNGLVADILEKLLNFVPRRGTAPVMIEKMVRSILQHNKYFAIWPEGTGSPDGQILEGFSSIVRVYATLNAKKDVIPFVPVLTRGNESYWWHGIRRPSKILIEFVSPIFIPRDWLRPPNNGGKTPREIIDALMMVLARKLGQESLAPNRLLDRRRQGARKSWGR